MKVIGYWLLVIELVFSAQAELSVTLEPEEASRFVYEPFGLILQADGQIERPNIPDGSDYSLTGLTEIDGGYRIELIANEVGTFTLPPFTVTAGKETVKTPVLRLPVSRPRRADGMDISMAFSTTNPVAGEPVELTVTWKTDVPFTRCQELQFILPLLGHPDWKAYLLTPDVPEKERIGLPVNNQRIIAKNAPDHLQFSCRLVPKKAGIYQSPAQLSCALLETHRSASQYPSYFDNHFFNIPDKKERFERIYLTAQDPELTVQPLPDEGRSIRFSGIVGNCSASASIKPVDTVVGQPMLLSITLSDLPFSGHIHTLPEATLDGLGSEFRINREPMHVKTEAASKTFTYIVRPLRSGLTVLPALVFDIFDTKTRTYRTVRTAPLPITVAPDGEQTVYTPSIHKKPMIPLNGIRHNRIESESAMYAFLEFLSDHIAIFWPLPVFLWLLLRPWVQRRDRCRIDPAYARALRATARFNKQVLANEEAAWEGWFADRFNLTAEAITFETVKPHLKHIDADLLTDVESRFKAEEAKHYAPPGTPERDTAAVRKLIHKLNKAIPVLLLAIALIPTIGKTQSAEELFEQAMKIRSERPDEAVPLLTESALSFEAEGNHFNAGNSWFFVGENGRALAAYRAAESRRPYDKQIRESIAFILAQRSDSPVAKEPTLPIQRIWSRLCSYHPSLRFGLLTLMYLVAWAAFLTARIMGKTIRRKAWVVYGCHAAAVVLSLVWSLFQPSEGVIIQPTEARLGPGYAYEQAYENLLHEAVEFQWLEERDGWVLAHLPDNTEAWLRETACVKIR